MNFTFIHNKRDECFKYKTHSYTLPKTKIIDKPKPALYHYLDITDNFFPVSVCSVLWYGFEMILYC